jgi:biopolymer transport protein TolR
MASKHPTPEINVTPLVDVVLVLLIIFMVIAPAIANEDRVLLPEAENPDAKKEDEAQPWEVVLTQAGTFLLDEQAMTPEALHVELARRKQREPTRKLLLLADGRLGYGRVRDAFVMLQAVGFRGVSLKVLEREQGA